MSIIHPSWGWLVPSARSDCNRRWEMDMQVWLEGSQANVTVEMPSVPTPGSTFDISGARPMGRDRRLSEEVVVLDEPVHYRVAQQETGEFEVRATVKVARA